MKLVLLSGIAALSLAGATAAQAETIYTTDSAVVADPYLVNEPNVIATTPGQVIAVPAPPFGPFTPQYIVTQPTVVVAPPVAAPREQVIERERVVVAPRGRVAAPRERVIERERVLVEPRERVVVEPRERVITPGSGIVTTGYSSNGCFIDLNGFERCY